MPEPTFTPGQRVRVTDPSGDPKAREGDEGVVTQVEPDTVGLPGLVYVRLDRGGYLAMYAKRFAPAWAYGDRVEVVGYDDPSVPYWDGPALVLEDHGGLVSVVSTGGPKARSMSSAMIGAFPSRYIRAA